MKIGEYEVRTWYAGLTMYAVFKNGEEVYCGCSVDEIIRRFGFNPNE